DKPVAEDDQFAIETGAQPTAGSKQQAFTLDVLANDSDIDGDALSVIRVSAPETGTASIPQNSQAISYTPPQIFSGTVEITYVVTDGALNDTASVMVDVTAVDERPVARDDAFDLDEDASLQLDILANDTDPENDPLTVEIIEEVQNGTLQPLPNSRFRYTPNQNFAGSDGFTYRVSDGTFVSDTATVTIRVRPVNDLPLALNDTYDLGSDQTLNEPAPGVLANDSDPDIGDELRARLIDNVQNGVLTLQPNGSFSYRPNAGFSGTDTFTYRAGDGFSESNIATVTLRVEQSNRPPQAADDALEVQHGRVLDIRISTDVLANDTDADGDDLTFELTAGTTQGDLVQIDGDQWTYTPRVEFVGQDTFRYRARDASTASNVATVTISVVNSNLPVAVDDSLTTTLDQEIVIDPVALLSNDTDADGDALTVIFDSPPSNGSLIENADGTVTYFPNAGFQGVDQFTYRASDGIALSEPAAVVITVE
ncbi:MAG: Ig-like domain-containing protein, partial [Bacteroidota bacterium]